MNRVLSAAACAVAMLIVSGGASALGAEPDRDADWLRRPTPQDLLSVWPQAALKKGVGGKAVIDCKISVQGALFDCNVVSETPVGMGFGSAAIALTPQLLFKPAIKGGKPVVVTVRLPVEFMAPNAPTGSHLRGSSFYQDAPADTLISNVRWVSAPSYDDVVAAYPTKARNAHAGGRATLNCRIGSDGALKACSTIAEAPRGMGFSQAARTVVKAFRAPTTAGDKSTSGFYTQVVVTFAPDMLDRARRTIGKPKWARLPDPEAFRAAYLRAIGSGDPNLEARVMLDCQVAPSGGLVDCKVASETPAGLGLGQATLALTDGFRLAIWTDEGLPVVGGTVRVPVRYGGPAKPPGAAP